MKNVFYQLLQPLLFCLIFVSIPSPCIKNPPAVVSLIFSRVLLIQVHSLFSVCYYGFAFIIVS